MTSIIWRETHARTCACAHNTHKFIYVKHISFQMYYFIYLVNIVKFFSYKHYGIQCKGLCTGLGVALNNIYITLTKCCVFSVAANSSMNSSICNSRRNSFDCNSEKAILKTVIELEEMENQKNTAPNLLTLPVTNGTEAAAVHRRASPNNAD